MNKDNCAVKIYRPKGNSMHPFLRENSVLIVKKVPEHFLRVGDVVIIRGEKDVCGANGAKKSLDLSPYVAHRLIKKTKIADKEFLFQTKGDANYFFDCPVSYEDIIGKVYFIAEDDRVGGNELLDLDSWCRRKINYLMAKIGCFEVVCYRFFKYFQYGLRRAKQLFLRVIRFRTF